MDSSYPTRQKQSKFKKLQNLWKMRENETITNLVHRSFQQKSCTREEEDWNGWRRKRCSTSSEESFAISNKKNDSVTSVGEKMTENLLLVERMSTTESSFECCSSACDSVESQPSTFPRLSSTEDHQEQLLPDSIQEVASRLDETAFGGDSDNDSPSWSLSARSKRCGIKRKKSNAQANLLENTKASPIVEQNQHQFESDFLLSSRKSFPRSRGQSDFPGFGSFYFPRKLDAGSDLSRSDSIHVCRSKAYHQQRAFRYDDFIHGDVLGQGFFGKAVKVTHRTTGEIMVLKVLNSLEPDLEKSFLQEVKMMRKLEHPNIIHFLGVVYENERLSIITEFADGGTLKESILNPDKCLSWKARVEIARDICHGMLYLHSKNIIHRDLNSGNCFVKSNGTVVVADFGLARLHLSNASRKKRYTVVGNPYCMAPEMLNGKDYNEKVDVFSFGIILCELIGRIDADPEILPRRNDFGLAVKEFFTKYCENCPAFYFAIAVITMSLNPNNRPSFQTLSSWYDVQMIRKELLQLPEPPDLYNAVIAVYNEYEFSLPQYPCNGDMRRTR